jgi:hypothetical protein
MLPPARERLKPRNLLKFRGLCLVAGAGNHRNRLAFMVEVV